MSFKSKKAMTLVEVLVSITILSLISITLLGLIVSSANAQSTAAVRSKASFKAAEQLEKKIYSMKPEHSDLSDTAYISTQEHTLVLQFDGEELLCEGLIIESIDPESKVVLKGFSVNEEQTE